MSVESQTPGSQPEVFVTTADLSASRPPPSQANWLQIIRSSTAFKLLAVILYGIYLLVCWTSVESGLINLGFTRLELVGMDNITEGAILGIAVMIPLLLLIIVRSVISRIQTGVPIYRDLPFLRDLIQIVFLAIVAGAIYVLIWNLNDNLAQSGLRINFNVLGRTFGTEVTEGPNPRDELTFLRDIPIIGQSLDEWGWLNPNTNLRALGVGLINTLRVIVLSLVMATVLGVLLGIGLLSSNWLLNNASMVYVEVFRNTPLLVQLFFIYKGVLTILPRSPAEAYEFPGNVYLSGRGLNYPALLTTETFGIFALCALAGLIVGAILWRQRLKLNERTGVPANTLGYFLAAFLGFSALGVVAAYFTGGPPIGFEAPELGRFNFAGGASISAEYLGLAAGLVLYTSAFIADIVRAGIQAVPSGQIEAAKASGLKGGQTLRLIVLPQALRLIVPPLTNQYLNLTKNSSLGIAIGFYDVYNVANVVSNQTGQAVALFAFLMVTYLLLSLIISLFMNIFNLSLRLKSR
jgi:general L-amino acid transport system permease protein